MTAERPADEAALTEAERRGLGTRLAGILDGAVDDAADWLAPVVEAIIAARLASEGEILDAAADEIEDLRKRVTDYERAEALAAEGHAQGRAELAAAVEALADRFGDIATSRAVLSDEVAADLRAALTDHGDALAARTADARAEGYEAGRAEVTAAVEALHSALERTEANFVRAVNGKPVRDMAETLAENRAALAAAPTLATVRADAGWDAT